MEIDDKNIEQEQTLPATEATEEEHSGTTATAELAPEQESVLPEDIRMDASFSPAQYAVQESRSGIGSLFAAGVEPEEMHMPSPSEEGVLAAVGEFEGIKPAPDDDIPWRSIPPLPTAEPLVMGVLKGGEEVPHEEYAIPFAHDPAFTKAEEKTPAAIFASPPPEATELVLGVKLRQHGPVYFFRTGGEVVRTGGKVLVETDQGLSLAEVISARRLKLPLPKLRTAEGEEIEIKTILGLAGPEDIAAASDNKILSASARMFCKECIRERELDMKLVDVEVLHDRSKIIFYFTAPARIDFRELVKDLVRNYRTRIELRQIGVRHETQMVGALGNCGMTCCCRRYLRKFAPVTIKMAKEQNLFLNPAKLSGICGRLLCCLSYEQENYELFHKRSPKLGKRYETTQGVLKVVRANLFRQSIVTISETGEEGEFQLDDWEALNPKRLETPPPPKEETAESERRHGSEKRRHRPPQQPNAKKEREPHYKADMARLADSTSLDDEAPAALNSASEDSLRTLEDHDDGSIFGLSGAKQGGKNHKGQRNRNYKGKK